MYVTGHSKVLSTLQECDPEAYRSGIAWISIIQHEETIWINLKDVQRFDPDVIFISPYTIFKLRGNEYRIISEIQYKSRWVELLSICKSDLLVKDDIHGFIKTKLKNNA